MNKICSIKSKKDFDKIFKFKKQFNSSLYTVLYNQNLLNNHRFGILISKKKVKKAVDRNFFRRQIKSILRSIDDSNEKKKLDIIIIIKNNFSEQSYQNKKKELLALFNKIVFANN